MGVRRWGVLLVCVLVVAASCGDDDDDDASDSGTTTTAPAEETGSTEPTDGAEDTTTTAAGGGGGGGGGASADPAVAEATSTQDFLDRLAQLEAAVFEIADPVAPVEGETTRGVSEDSILVGAVTGLTTEAGIEPFPGMCQGMMARIERANAEGGVTTAGGVTRTIELAGRPDDQGRVCADDTTNRDRNRQLLQDMVEDEEVFAILNLTSNGFFAGDYLNEEHVPFFGYGYSQEYCGPDRAFAFSTAGGGSCEPMEDHEILTDLTFRGYLQAVGSEPSEIRAAVMGFDNPASVKGVDLIADAFEAGGAEVVLRDNSFAAPDQPQPTDMSSFVNSILDSDPTVFVWLGADLGIPGLTSGLRGAGYEGDVLQFVFADERMFLAFENFQGLDGSYTSNNFLGTPLFESEAFDQIAADLEAAGFTYPLTNGVLHGYASADMFIAALEEAPEPLTTESYVNAVNAGWNYEGFGNAICPMRWPLGHFTFTPCGSVLQINGEGTNSLEGLGFPATPGGFDPIVDMFYANLVLRER